MTQNNKFASPNASPADNYYLQADIADLSTPEYTGDFYPKAQSRDEDKDLRTRLNRNYEILLDTINLISREPGPGWSWQNLDSLVTPDRIKEWSAKWGNPGLWYKPISSVEFQKHAVILFLIYQLYCLRDDRTSNEMVFHYYAILLSNPYFEKRPAREYLRLIKKFETETEHRIARINSIITLIIDHEIQNLISTYHTERGFGFRAASLLPTIYYQLGILIRSGDISSRKIRKCQNCNRLFWGHANRRYCEFKACDRRYVYKRKTNKRGDK